MAYLVTLFRRRKVPRWGHWVARRLKRIRIKNRRPVFAAARWMWRQITYVHPSTMSAWGALFADAKVDKMLVDIRLTDGAWVSGALMSYSTIGADTPDRDLILGPPIKFRGPRGKNLNDYPTSAVVISARQVSAMFATDLSGDQNINDKRPQAVSHPLEEAAEEAASPGQ